MTDELLRVEAVSRRFGSLVALDRVDLQVARGTVHAIIGPNGAGKTTLFNILSGELAPSSGHVIFEERRIDRLQPSVRARIGIGRSFQVTSVFQTLTVFENVRVACQARDRSAFNFLSPVTGRELAAEHARDLLARVGLADHAGDRAGELSHGRQRLLEVALALASQPRLLLLDEPTAGMGTEDIDVMQELIAELATDHTIVLIEHNVSLVMDVSDRVTVLDHGRVLAAGDPEQVANDARVRDAYLGVPV